MHNTLILHMYFEVLSFHHHRFVLLLSHVIIIHYLSSETCACTHTHARRFFEEDKKKDPIRGTISYCVLYNYCCVHTAAAAAAVHDCLLHVKL